MTIKNKVINFLEEREAYQESDDILIEELVFNIWLSKEFKKDIKKGVYTTRDLDNYDKTFKRVTHLFTKLALSPQDRLKLKLKVSEKADLLDNILN